MEPSTQIDQYIANLNDWQGEQLTRLRQLILDADPEITEEWKWKGVPVWSHDGVIAFANGLKDKVKIGFLQGAHLADPHKLFNAELEGSQRRAIELRQGETIDEQAFKDLICTGVAYNQKK